MATGFARIINQLGYKRQFLNPGCVRVIVPGLPYTAFDAFEHPNPWSVMCTMDSAKATVIYTSPSDDKGSLMDLHQLYETQLAYIVASRVDFFPSLYNKTIMKSPLYVDTTVTNMGKTTIVLKTEMKTDQCTLATIRNQQIFLDMDSKKPVQLPHWWRQKHGHLCASGQPIKFPVLERPSLLSRIKKVSIGQIPFSDLDPYFHVNSTNFIKYCVDAVIQGQKLHSIPDTSLVKSALTWYRKECSLGDTLEVEYWKDEIRPYTFYLDMLRDDSSVCQCILELNESTKINSSL